MGWRSWNAFGANINNKTFVATIDAITSKDYMVDGVKKSLADIGYASVGIDEVNPRVPQPIGARD